MVASSAFFLWKTYSGPEEKSKSGAKKAKVLDRAALADVIDDINLLGEVKYTQEKDGSKLLEKKYFVELIALITFHVRQEFREEKSELVGQRRAIFDDQQKAQAYEDLVREIYLKQETLFNQMCEEVFSEISLSKEVFLESQQKYMADAATREDISRAVQTGHLPAESLKEKPDLAKSMQLQISAIAPVEPLQRGDTMSALKARKQGYQRQRTQLDQENANNPIDTARSIEEVI